MFRELIKKAQSAADSLVSRYVARVSVVVPFLIAFGFGTAAVALMLIERFGHRDAYLIIAGGFAIVGLLSALIVRAREHGDKKTRTTWAAGVFRALHRRSERVRSRRWEVYITIGEKNP